MTIGLASPDSFERKPSLNELLSMAKFWEEKAMKAGHPITSDRWIVPHGYPCAAPYRIPQIPFEEIFDFVERYTTVEFRETSDG